MPYSYHKEGDKYVVTKKDTGKVVGRTKGTKEALKKYLAALHINANEGKTNEVDYGQALFNRLKPKDSELEEIVNILIQDPKIANAPDQASFKENLERYIKFNGDRDPIGQAAVRALNYRTTGDRYGNGFTRIFDMLINKKNLPEAKSNTMKKSELTKMIQEVIKEVINEYSVYQGDVSKMKPKPTPKEGEVYLKDLKPGDKFKPLKSDLEYIVVTPENGIRGVGVKHVDGTGNMNFRGDVIVKVISEQSTNKEGWLVKSNEDDTKYIVVHTSKVDNKSNRISQIYKDKKLADKRANDLNKKPGFNKYEEIVSKSETETSMNEASMLDKYEVDFFHTKANVYANIEIPSENPTFEDDIQIKGTGKTEEEAFEDLKQNYEKYKKTGINEAKKEDAVDTITMDIPLFLRMLEYSREDASQDMDLHDVTEKANKLGKERGILSMEDYEEIIGAAEDINELSDYFKRRKAQDDYAVNKKLRKSLTDETNESVDYDTAVAYRLITSGNREEVMAKVQGLIDNLTTGKSSKFQEVKVTMIPSKGNPNDIILKLNGPGAFSMSKDIKARPELKGVKVSTYKPQLTKI
jgi:hypothetical protein